MECEGYAFENENQINLEHVGAGYLNSLLLQEHYKHDIHIEK
jgi:hypothetical protein